MSTFSQEEFEAIVATLRIKGDQINTDKFVNTIHWSIDMDEMNLSGVDFTDSMIPDVTEMNFDRCDLSDADLTLCTFQRCTFIRANLTRADLKDADFRTSDLTHANLTRANLRNCIGNGREIKNIFDLDYPITYTAERLQIGCQNHAIDDWYTFPWSTIARMDGDEAVEFWENHKDEIFEIIAKDPATPTGYETKVYVP
tara:strand:+ start:2101 stop:2697 length:597 start_codon:yes stop_codon:yes gene_type:complete